MAGKLTTMKLKALTLNDVGQMLQDGEGLRGRVKNSRHNGISVYFEYRYRNGKKSHTVHVGKYPQQSLADIRVEHRRLKVEQKKGSNPAEVRRAAKLANQVDIVRQAEAHRAELQQLEAESDKRRTLREAVTTWIQVELVNRNDQGREALRSIEKDVFPALGDKALVNITKPMLLEVFDAIVARGANSMANHLFADLSQFFTFCMHRELVQKHPLAGIKKERIGGKSVERSRFLSVAEIVELQACLAASGLGLVYEIFLWLLLATGCRVGEFSNLRWEYINWESRELLIPEKITKNQRAHDVYLSEFAINKFRQLYEITGDSVWCFPGRNDGQPIGSKTFTKKIKDRQTTNSLANRANNNTALLLSGGHWTPHDLRRTAATYMSQLKVSRQIIERCLNHQEPNKLVRTYQRHEFREEQREAWILLGGQLEKILSGKEHGEKNLTNAFHANNFIRGGEA